jgi:hypothetical protein
MNDSNVADEPPAEETLAQTACRLFCGSQIKHLDRPIPWLWHGFVSRCQLTLLTGQWKIGKTTLLAALLARLGSGGSLAGRRVEPGRAVVITEEGVNLWLKRLNRHGIGDWVSFAFHPFVRKPLPRQWELLLADLAELHRRRPIDLLVLDPLVAVLPGQEECSGVAMTDTLRPLRELAALGPGVLILHHPRKGLSMGGQGARGTGVLPAFVDILMEMHWPGPPSTDTRRRRLTAWSRHDETPRRLLMELSDDGTDYTVVPDDRGEMDYPNDTVWRTVESLLRNSDSERGLTRRELLDRWPGGGEAPPGDTPLYRRLCAMLQTGRLTRSGRGQRFSPYRYRLAEAVPRP